MPRHFSRAALAVALGLTVVLTGCTAGPDVGPNVVRGDGGSDHGGESALPHLAAPENDLDYSSCGRTVSSYKVDVPDDVDVECATFDAPLDPSEADSGEITIGVVKVSTDKTPEDAAPLVLTTGSDLPTSRLLLEFAGDATRSLLDAHPVVAVDRRGIGLSGALDCLTRQQRSTIAANGASGTRDVEKRATELANEARLGADICNDTLSPDQLQYSAAAAASDLEHLRSLWNVDRLALAGVGNGSSVALAYQAKHPDQVGRLILDSPIGYKTQATEAAAARAAGLQNSLATFATRCSNVGCSLGGDAVGTLNRVVSAGASGSLPGLSDTSILNAITTALAVGDTDPDGLKKLADAISEADKDDAGALRALADTGNELREADGNLVSRCNDMVGRPGLDDIPTLAREWSKDAPITATSTALDLARCDGWGVADDPGAPRSFPVAPVVFAGANDPVNGAKAAEALIPLLVTTGADATTITWDGLGYSVLSRSECAADVTVEYLGDEPLSGPGERVCPS